MHKIFFHISYFNSLRRVTLEPSSAFSRAPRYSVSFSVFGTAKERLDLPQVYFVNELFQADLLQMTK